jgi:hypothetical protein
LRRMRRLDILRRRGPRRSDCVRWLLPRPTFLCASQLQRSSMTRTDATPAALADRLPAGSAGTAVAARACQSDARAERASDRWQRHTDDVARWPRTSRRASDPSS